MIPTTLTRLSSIETDLPCPRILSYRKKPDGRRMWQWRTCMILDLAPIFTFSLISYPHFVAPTALLSYYLKLRVSAGDSYLVPVDRVHVSSTSCLGAWLARAI